MYGRQPEPTWFDVLLGAMLGINVHAAPTQRRHVRRAYVRPPVFDFFGAQQDRLLRRVEEALDEVSQQPPK